MLHPLCTLSTVTAHDASPGRVCAAGKGLFAVLLSFLLPNATIGLFDANGAMDLRHVAERPQLRFRQIDLFAAEALE